ncbi:MAG TPA: CapA family protein, partial [Humibacillus sp.]|nr:CapA family protein [Humibacillus sp.]
MGRRVLAAMVAVLAAALASCSGPSGPSGPPPAEITSASPGSTTSTATAATAPPVTAHHAAPAASAAPAGTRSITVGWAGDAVPADVRQGLPPDPGDLLGKVSRVLTSPDLMVVNLEGTLGSRGLSKCVRWRVRDCHAFQAPSAYADRVFAASGVDLVNLANNHSYDFGDEGQTDTRRALASAGVATTGGEGEVRVVETHGVRVAVVGLAPYGWC